MFVLSLGFPIVFCRSRWQSKERLENKHCYTVYIVVNCISSFGKELQEMPGRPTFSQRVQMINGRHTSTTTHQSLQPIFKHVQRTSLACLLIFASLTQSTLHLCFFISFFWLILWHPEYFLKSTKISVLMVPRGLTFTAKLDRIPRYILPEKFIASCFVHRILKYWEPLPLNWWFHNSTTSEYCLTTF